MANTPHGRRSEAYRPAVMGRQGMVAAGHPLAAQAGLRILLQGGHAVDGALATAAALGVVEPAMSGIGGDGFIMVYEDASGEVACINGTGAAPARATRERFLPAGIPEVGILTVSVPGIVDAWLAAHERYGRLPLERVFEPAIDLADNGFPVTPKLAELIASHAPIFAPHPGSCAIFMPDGNPLDAGEMLIQRDLARTYRNLAREGRDLFYEGEIAEKIDAASAELDGLITADDLAAHRVRRDTPIRTTYRGHDVYEYPPNSSGHVLLQELNMVEGFDLARMGWLSTDCIHVSIEAKKLAFADREAYMADPDTTDIPLEVLLSKEYADQQRQLIDPSRSARDVRAGALAPAGGSDTTYFSVVDRWGNGVSMLQSLQTGFGSGIVAGNTGVLLNNRMTYWHLEEDHPDCLAPGKRVRHTMNPVIILYDGKLFLVCGTPGADTQVQTNLQLVTAIVDFGLGPQEAVEAPRWRHTQPGTESTYPHTCSDELLLEERFTEDVRKGLAAKGHALSIIGPWEATGSAMAIRAHPDVGVYEGGADPRKDGYVAAW